MKARIVIMPNGEIGFFTEEGTFEAGKAKLEKLIQLLGANGVKLNQVNEPEQHRHDDVEHLLAGEHAG
jgi:hypothetical protein